MSRTEKYFFVFALWMLFGLGAAGRLEGAWLEDYQKALQKSKKQGKYILADFTGSDWCGWCIKLQNEVFSQPAFTSWAAKNVILLELDYPRKKKLSQKIKEQNDELLSKYGIDGFPSIRFLDPEGNVVGSSGYQKGGAMAWVASAESILSQLPALTPQGKPTDEEAHGLSANAAHEAPEFKTTVFLKNGSSLKGNIIKQDDGVLVDQGAVKIFIENAQIDKVEEK